jgi:hypothetical protein
VKNVTRGDPRHDADRHARLHQRLPLLAAAPEDERIAPLQPQHPFACQRQLDQPQRDVALLRARLAAALARVFHLRIRTRPAKNAFIDQRVVDDHISLTQRVQRVQRHQPRIARPGADKPDPTGQKLGPAGVNRGEVRGASHRIDIVSPTRCAKTGNDIPAAR